MVSITPGPGRRRGRRHRWPRSRPALGGVDAIVVPGRRRRRAGHGPPARSRPARAAPRLGPRRPAVSRHLPGLPAPLRRQRRGRRRDARPAGRPHGRRSLDAPTLPHIGWNSVETVRPHPLFDGVPDGSYFYFVHSYAPVPADERIVLARTTHGRPFVSAVASRLALRPAVPPREVVRGRPPVLANFVWRPRRRSHRGPGSGLMLARRVIPCLDVANGRVVKGTNSWT